MVCILQGEGVRNAYSGRYVESTISSALPGAADTCVAVKARQSAASCIDSESMVVWSPNGLHMFGKGRLGRLKTQEMLLCSLEVVILVEAIRLSVEQNESRRSSINYSVV